MTGINFDYSGAGIMGCILFLMFVFLAFTVYKSLNFDTDVFRKDAETYRAFSLDPKESTEKNAEKLWNIVEKATREQ